MKKVSWRGLAFENSSIDNSASNGDKSEKFLPHPNDNEYYKEYEIHEDEDHYNNEDEYNMPLTFEELQIDFERRNAKASIKLRETLTATLTATLTTTLTEAFDKRHADLKKSFEMGFK